MTWFYPRLNLSSLCVGLPVLKGLCKALTKSAAVKEQLLVSPEASASLDKVIPAFPGSLQTLCCP